MKKLDLINASTTLEYLPNFSRQFGPKVYIKRDDVGGRGAGGNKLRKYERIVAEAIAENADTLIIAGHYQSNASRALVGVACQLGLKAVVVCKDLLPKQNESFNQTGNALLMQLMNAEIVAINAEDDFITEMNKVADQIKAAGGKPYCIPFGGSNKLGSLGYVDCANEILDQFKTEGFNEPNYIITPLGSGGTMAGLASGFALANATTQTIGFSVLHKDDTIAEKVNSLCDEIIEGKEAKVNVDYNYDFVGEGYGHPTQKGIEAIKTLAQLEGLFLCPVYTSKAMAGLIHYIEQGKITANDTVVFIHTGGSPLLHPYYNVF